MTKKEFESMFKAIGYIPAKETTNGKKLYIVQFDTDKVRIEHVVKAAPVIKKYAENIVFIPSSFNFMDNDELSRLREVLKYKE